eukprot:scaffold463_cov242-Pinguiococcus_pyrenoidosus.AAC.21
MENYPRLMNELMQVVGNQDWARARSRPDDEELGPSLVGLNASLFGHRCKVVIRDVPFEADAQGSTKKEAKKKAHKEVMRQIFPTFFHDDLSDAQITSGITRELSTAKAGNTLLELLQPGLESRAAYVRSRAPEEARAALVALQTGANPSQSLGVAAARPAAPLARPAATLAAGPAVPLARPVMALAGPALSSAPSAPRSAAYGI